MRNMEGDRGWGCDSKLAPYSRNTNRECVTRYDPLAVRRNVLQSTPLLLRIVDGSLLASY